MDEYDTDLELVVARERTLLDPAARCDRRTVETLLHPQFREHGASGRIWGYADTVEALLADPAVRGRAADFAASRLSDDVVLVTYRIGGDRPSLRSSVWVRLNRSWRLRFHQGTLVPH